MSRRPLPILAIVVGCLPQSVTGQNAEARFELPATLSAGGVFTHVTKQPPRAGSTVTGGARLVFYPTVKVSRHWFLSGAVQIHSRPYFYEELVSQGYGAKLDVLQGYLGYARYWGRSSLTVRMGQMSSAFGSFLLRYDDARNPLIDMPAAYGYYKPAGLGGLSGAQIDATLRKIDLRAQFANSSPSNRRSIFDRDQYGQWAGGLGYTISQGIRVGASAYRGPYLHRQSRFFRRGEIRPRDLPGSGLGLDVQIARGHWNFFGEVMRFQRAYTVRPTLSQLMGYGEARYALHPRWYIAARAGHEQSNRSPQQQTYDVTLGFRPDRLQILKVGYRAVRGPDARGTLNNVFGIQLVTRIENLAAGG